MLHKKNKSIKCNWRYVPVPSEDADSASSLMQKGVEGQDKGHNNNETATRLAANG